MFVYSRYWNTWSRLLATQHDCSPYTLTHAAVELDLTPVNAHREENWARIATYRIRAHHTPIAQPVDQLPENILEEMRLHLSEEVINKLLNYNFLPEIDWTKYKLVVNGGADFDDIKK